MWNFSIMASIIAFIPARGGSKGIPYKNIKNFSGKPLIVHTIEYALASKLVDEVVVSTEDSNISEISNIAGAKVIRRPKNLATDTATTESVIEHFLDELSEKPKLIILLQPTSPIRPKKSLDNAINHFIKHKFDSLLSISPTFHFFWKTNKNQTAHPEYDYLNRPRRQDMKSKDMKYLENGSLYIFTYDNFKKYKNRLGGKIGYVEWTEDYSMEIDTLNDFIILEQILKKMNL